MYLIRSREDFLFEILFWACIKNNDSDLADLLMTASNREDAYAKYIHIFPEREKYYLQYGKLFGSPYFRVFKSLAYIGCYMRFFQYKDDYFLGLRINPGRNYQKIKDSFIGEKIKLPSPHAKVNIYDKYYKSMIKYPKLFSDEEFKHIESQLEVIDHDYL